jgi:hypothetical protein
LSTPSSAPKANDRGGTLASQAEERFFTLDHVGVVRHFEGVGLDRITLSVSATVDASKTKVEQATEEVGGRTVYTCIASDWPRRPLVLWLKATLFEGVGVLVDAKIFHPTESSAEADEALSSFMEKLGEGVV